MLKGWWTLALDLPSWAYLRETDSVFRTLSWRPSTLSCGQREAHHYVRIREVDSVQHCWLRVGDIFHNRARFAPRGLHIGQDVCSDSRCLVGSQPKDYDYTEACAPLGSSCAGRRSPGPVGVSRSCDCRTRGNQLHRPTIDVRVW